MARIESTADAKLVDLPRLLERLAPERAAGRSVVFTNGCFDLLHAGHLRLLEQAAALGDLLVVGLNEDASVRDLKGDGRPLRPFSERALVLAGLSVVDWVVGFAESTPLELIRALCPDVLVKGGDWEPSRVVGREIVEAHGGKVISIPLLDEHSTTGLVERLRAAARQDLGTRDPDTAR